MIELRPIEDAAAIGAVMTHPAVWPWIIDDGLPASPPPDFVAPTSPDKVYLGAYQDGELVGIWRFDQRTDATYEVHTMLLPKAHGQIGLGAAKMAAEWFWRAFARANRLITMVPSDNRPALWFATQCGMTPWGKNPEAYRRAGKLLDEIWLGMSRIEEV